MAKHKKKKSMPIRTPAPTPKAQVPKKLNLKTIIKPKSVPDLEQIAKLQHVDKPMVSLGGRDSSLFQHTIPKT
jgi:hypothetical protein